MDDLKKDLEETKEELKKHNEGAKAQSAASGAGEPPTRLDGQNEESREMRQAIEQIKEDARNAEERLGLRIDEANGETKTSTSRTTLRGARPSTGTSY